MTSKSLIALGLLCATLTLLVQPRWSTRICGSLVRAVCYTTPSLATTIAAINSSSVLAYVASSTLFASMPFLTLWQLLVWLVPRRSLLRSRRTTIKLPLIPPSISTTKSSKSTMGVHIYEYSQFLYLKIVD